MLSFIFLSACEQDLRTDILIQEKLCLNCILNPDSTVKASLSLSQSISEEQTFTKINNARVELVTNGQTVTLRNSGDGLYSLGSKPAAGAVYEIRANVQGYPLLKATTKVSLKPDASVILTNPVVNENIEIYSYTANVTINDLLGINRYWFYDVYYLLIPQVKSVTFRTGYANIDSPLMDDFNKVTDATEPLGYRYEYYLRIKDTNNDGQQLAFNIGFWDTWKNEDYDMYHIMDVDEHYDKYLKSVIKQKMNENNVLFSEPVQIYTNIENGLGIFGSAAITSFKL